MIFITSEHASEGKRTIITLKGFQRRKHICEMPLEQSVTWTTYSMAILIEFIPQQVFSYYL